MQTSESKKEQILIKKYGITQEQYNTILINQNKQCAICKTQLELNTNKTHLDHNHSTGRIRGILCRTCNHLLGLANDDTRILENATSYLKKYDY